MVHVNAPGVKHSRKRMVAAVLALVVFPAAAAGYYLGYNVGEVALYVTDDAIAQFAHLNITFSEVHVKSGGALTMSDWTSFTVATTTVDLVDLHDNITALVAKAKLQAGDYTQLRLVLTSATGELKSGGAADVEVPSGELKTSSPFSVKPQGDLNLVLRLQVVEAGGRYNLRPVFAGAAHV